MNEENLAIEEAFLLESAKRFCFQCRAEIPKEWDNQEHFGTCPSCKRGNYFITGNSVRDRAEEQERERRAKNNLLGTYGVFQYDEKGRKKDIILPNLARLIMNEHGYHFLTLKDTGEIYRYNGSFYEPDGDIVIKNKVQYYLDTDSTEHHKNEVVGFIRDETYIDRGVFNQNINFINVKNGVYDITTKTLLPHSSDYHFLYEIRVNYNPNATCPNINKFFITVLREEDILLLLEVFGFCLYRIYSIQKAVLLVGGGSNGKTTVLILMRKMLGENNVASISLKDLNENRFASSNLYGKLANLHAEQFDTTLYKTGKFKMLTGGDLTGGEKKFKNPFNFVNYAKLIFSANQVPETKDETEAFFRRWIIITFPYRFVDEDSEVDNTTAFKKNPNIINDLTTEEELEGLLKQSLEGLERLLQQGKFSYSKTTEEIMDYYQRLSNPVTAFVKDELEVNPQCYIVKDDLFEEYKNYAQRNKLDILPKQTFSMKLQSQPIPLQDYRPKMQGKRPRCWKGIRCTVREEINHHVESEDEAEEIQEKKWF
jgi:putative DNA primase/helicase